MNVEDTRVEKLRLYLFQVIEHLLDNIEQINVDMLSNEIDNYSLDKIPTSPKVEKWVHGIEVHKDLYSFRSRRTYSQDTINNLKNIGFYELFESKIKTNNKNGILPEIDNIESIECLNPGTLISTDGKTATFDIQIQITYLI